MPDQHDQVANAKTPERPETAVPLPAEGLGSIYAALLESQAWQVDATEGTGGTPISTSVNSHAAIGQADSLHGNQTTSSAQSSDLSLENVPPPAHRIVEALLFVGGEPLTCEQACSVVPGMTPAEFLRCLDVLNRAYRLNGRPYRIRATNKAWELVLRPRFSAIVEKMHGGAREARLSSAALDVLSLVAYRQPLTKQEIEGMRGAESGAVLRQLVRRGLLMVAHTTNEGKIEPVYRTTPRFVEFFQLRGLEDLPQTQDLQRL